MKDTDSEHYFIEHIVTVFNQYDEDNWLFDQEIKDKFTYLDLKELLTDRLNDLDREID